MTLSQSWAMITDDLPSRRTRAMCPTDSLRYHPRAIATGTFLCQGENSTLARYCNIAFFAAQPSQCGKHCECGQFPEWQLRAASLSTGSLSLRDITHAAIDRNPTGILAGGPSNQYLRLLRRVTHTHTVLIATVLVLGG